jgi:hypothetical protein
MQSYNLNIVTQWNTYRSFNNSDLETKKIEMKTSPLQLSIDNLMAKGYFRSPREANQPLGYLYKMSWTLTPNVETILKMLLPGMLHFFVHSACLFSGEPQTLLQLAAIGNKKLLPWFNVTISSNPKWSYPYLCNIIIIDDALNSDLFRVIQYNLVS